MSGPIFELNDKPLKSNRIYSLVKATDEHGVEWLVKRLNIRELKRLNLEQHIHFNQAVLNDLSDQKFPEQFLQIKYELQKNGQLMLFTQPYKTTLETYLRSKVIEEKEAMEIFSQVVKAMFSLQCAQFKHRNIRPEHFVKVGQVWKLESLILDQTNQYQLESQYLWNPFFQPPQAYGKTIFESEQLDQMAVWHAGSLLLDLLVGHHKLKSLESIKNLRYREFSFKEIGVKKQFSPSLENFLKKMLAYHPQDRMTLQQLFNNQFWTLKGYSFNQNSEVFKQSNNQQSSLPLASENDGIRQNTKSSFRCKNKSSFRWSKQSRISTKSNDPSSILKEKVNPANSNVVVLDFSKKEFTSKNSVILFEANNIKRQILSSIKVSNQLSPIPQATIQESFKTKSNTNWQPCTDRGVSKAAIIYQNFYDRCQILGITLEKLEKLPSQFFEDFDRQTLALSKYALNFVFMMSLHRLNQSTMQNQNFFGLQTDLWVIFQQSKQYRWFKQMLNYQIGQQERKSLMSPLRQGIFMLQDYERNLLQDPEIEDFAHQRFQNCTQNSIRSPYQKILKTCFRTISEKYSKENKAQLASLVVYLILSIKFSLSLSAQERQDNLKFYFDYTRTFPKDFIPLDEFEDYIEKAERKTIQKHANYLMNKYETVLTQSK